VRSQGVRNGPLEPQPRTPAPRGSLDPIEGGIRTLAQVLDPRTLDQGASKLRTYCGGLRSTPDWRRSMTDRLEMGRDGVWPDGARLAHH